MLVLADKLPAPAASEDESLASSSLAARSLGVNAMRMEVTTVKTKARAIFSKHWSRVRFYDAIPSNEDGHPVDLVVQRWLPHETEHQRILTMQDEQLALLAPDERSVFLELEELHNEVGAEREEAYFDLGVSYGIERERRRCFRRFGRADDALLAFGEVLAEYLDSSAGSSRGAEKRADRRAIKESTEFIATMKERTTEARQERRR